MDNKQKMFQRISESRPKYPIKEFASGHLPHTILSSMSNYLLPMLNIKTRLVCRSTCKEFKDAITNHPWDNYSKNNDKYTYQNDSIIRGDVSCWLRVFPRAYAVILNDDRRFMQLTNYDLQFVRGIRNISMTNCIEITDDALVHLQGIHTLNIAGCYNITDLGISHLGGIHTLNISGCYKITNHAFSYIQGIKSLNISGCINITDDAFIHLRGIETLNMNKFDTCIPTNITDNAFIHLNGIKNLDISYNYQFTDKIFEYLGYVEDLKMRCCNKITDNAFMHLVNIKHLDISLCDQILGDGFVYLTNLQTLKMHLCTRIHHTFLAYLKNIKHISMDGCSKKQKDFAYELGILF